MPLNEREARGPFHFPDREPEAGYSRSEPWRSVRPRPTCRWRPSCGFLFETSLVHAWLHGKISSVRKSEPPKRSIRRSEDREPIRRQPKTFLKRDERAY